VRLITPLVYAIRRIYVDIRQILNQARVAVQRNVRRVREPSLQSLFISLTPQNAPQINECKDEEGEQHDWNPNGACDSGYPG
jgi:hypothetical protein